MIFKLMKSTLARLCPLEFLPYVWAVATEVGGWHLTFAGMLRREPKAGGSHTPSLWLSSRIVYPQCLLSYSFAFIAVVVRRIFIAQISQPFVWRMGRRLGKETTQRYHVVLARHQHQQGGFHHSTLEDVAPWH